MTAHLCCQDRIAGYIFLPLSFLCSTHLSLPSEKACLVILTVPLQYMTVWACDSPTLCCSRQKPLN